MAKEFCPECGKQFECLTEDVYENGGALMVYSNDMVVCDDCDKYEVWTRLKYNTRSKTIPDSYKVWINYGVNEPGRLTSFLARL